MVSSRDAHRQPLSSPPKPPPLSFFGAPRNISNQGEKPFPVGISSTTPAVASRSAARLTL